MIKAIIGRPQEVIAMGVTHAQHDPAGIIGPWFLAIIGYTFLMGVIAVQTTRYFSTYGIESGGIFALVMCSMVLITVQWGVVISAGWDWFVKYYGNWALIVSAPWQAWTSPALNTFIVFVSQIFFAHRCYVLYDRKILIFAGLLVGMLASVAFGIMSGITIAVDPYNFAMGKAYAIPGAVISLATDCAIAGLILWQLNKHGGVTFNPSTKDVLQRLRSITLEAAVPPAFFSFFNMVCYVTMGTQNLAFVFFGIITPCFYVCSFLYVLNSRIDVRRKLNATSPQDDADTLSTRFEFSPVTRSKTRNTISETRNTIYSTATVPDFAPSNTNHANHPAAALSTPRFRLVDTRVDKCYVESFAESGKSEIRVDLDRWDDHPPSPHSKASIPLDGDRVC